MKKPTKRKISPNPTILKVIGHFGTQQKMAEAMGTTQQYISKIVNGKCDLSLLYAMKIEKLTRGKFTLKALLSEKKKCYLKNT